MNDIEKYYNMIGVKNDDIIEQWSIRSLSHGT